MARCKLFNGDDDDDDDDDDGRIMLKKIFFDYFPIGVLGKITN